MKARSVGGLLTAALLCLTTSVGAQVQEQLDRRFAFDSAIRDATRITAIINKIEAEESLIETQLADVTRNKNDLGYIISQFRNANVPSRIDASAIPQELADLTKSTSFDEQMNILRKNIPALEKLVPEVQRRDQAISRLREIVPAPRRVPQVSPDQQFKTDISNRVSRRLDALTSKCSLQSFNEAIIVLKKPKETDNRKLYADVELSSDAELVGAVQTCLDALSKPIDAGEVRTVIVTDLAALEAELAGRISRLNTGLGNLEDAKSKWQGHLRRATDISNSLIDWTIPILAVSVVALLLIPALYSREVQELVISNGIILEVFTVFLLITTVLLLGIAERIQSESLGTLLGGISGYVLGRSVAQRPKLDPTGNPQQAQSPRAES